MEGGQRLRFIKTKEGRMKCALLLKGLTMEASEISNFSMESVGRKAESQIPRMAGGAYAVGMMTALMCETA